jgi:hypothetical protein
MKRKRERIMALIPYLNGVQTCLYLSAEVKATGINAPAQVQAVPLSNRQ